MNKYIPYFELAAFLASLFAWRQLKSSPHLIWFPVLLFVVVVVEVPMIMFRLQLPLNNALIYNIQVPLQHLIYLQVLRLSLRRLNWKRFALFSAITLAAFATITTLWVTPAGQFNVLAYCLGLLFISICILAQFYEMLQNPVNLNFLKDPYFYILFVFLLFSVVTLPYFGMINWLTWIASNADLMRAFNWVMSIFNCLLYATFTFAFVWMKLKKAH